MESWLDRAHQHSKNATQNKIFKRAVKLDNMAHTVFIRQFERFFGEGYKQTFSSKRINYVAPQNEVCQVQATCTIIDALLDDNYHLIRKMKKKDKESIYD